MFGQQWARNPLCREREWNGIWLSPREHLGQACSEYVPGRRCWFHHLYIIATHQREERNGLIICFL